MRAVRNVSLGCLVLAMVSIVGAQDLGDPADFLDEWLDEEVVNEIETSLPTIGKLFAPEGDSISLFESLRAASRRFSGSDDELLDVPRACGTADGSGGVPRIGGGGDLGTAESSLIRSAPNLSSLLVGPTRLAVIDEFDFSEVVAGGQAALSDPALGQPNPWSDWLGYRGWASIDELDGVPHGHFVTFHLLSLSGAGQVNASTHTMTDGAGHTTEYAVLTTGSLEIWLVDIDFDDVWTAVWAIRSLEMMPTAPTVLNLSWYIIDCDIRQDYEMAFGFSVTPGDQLVTNVSDHFHKTSERFLDEYGPDAEVPCNRALSLVPFAPDCSSLLAVAGILDMQVQLTSYTDVQ
ncbi:MAG TPA: hypothetical protein VFN03_10805, partial [Trueperaceae bacterium]|nr:hypothetical protein [Trueperaceae bacterium]